LTLTTSGTLNSTLSFVGIISAGIILPELAFSFAGKIEFVSFSLFKGGKLPGKKFFFSLSFMGPFQIKLRSRFFSFSTVLLNSFFSVSV
jgi:hypothetical protein